MVEKVKKGRGSAGKRAAALLMVVCIVISLLVIPAAAADTTSDASTVTDLTGTTWQLNDVISSSIFAYTFSGVYVITGEISSDGYSLTLPYIYGNYTYDKVRITGSFYSGPDGNCNHPVFQFGVYDSGSSSTGCFISYYNAGNVVSETGWRFFSYKYSPSVPLETAPLISAPVLSITGGDDATNADLIAWLYANGTLLASAAECTHTNTEVRNATDYYTGDTYCADCGELISSGTYALNGWWVFKENVGAPLTAPLVEDMAFACCGRNFDSLGWTGSNAGIYYGNVKVYDNITGWTNDIYRTVNLGDALIPVSKNFAVWLGAYATRYDQCPHVSAVELDTSGQQYCYSCESIVYAEGSCSHSNTYVKNQSTTYSGDTYCLDCGALISTGSALECPHSNTVIRDQTDYYTGDMYCADCGALLAEGEEDPDGVLNSEEDKANSGGNSSVDDLTGAIPDYSGEFVEALKSFAAAFSYEGTDAVLTIPPITIPGIAGLIPETVIYAGQQFDFGDYFGLLPATLLLLVQALLTVALIVYCFKELYSMISYALTLRRGGSDGE